MSETMPGRPRDEPAGDMGDQASRLQMAQEQEAIRAALAGRVRGTDAIEDRSPFIEPLEGLDPLEADEVEASDDPVHGGGMALSDPEQAMTLRDHTAAGNPDLAMTGLADDGAAMAVEEGSSLGGDPAVRGFEDDGDPDVLGEELLPVDDVQAAEDLDALDDLHEPSHDPDDPQDPDGYGVPPASDAARDL
jgi:hypothetical protein